jgi:hypothetical protein
MLISNKNPRLLGRGLASDGWRMERAMGIEPMGKALAELENKRFRANAEAKCD